MTTFSHDTTNQPKVLFSKPWNWFFDEALPNYVKKKYSPKESWKQKPFSKIDIPFFVRGIEELSEIFTEERNQKILLTYLQQPRFRSSYLLYYLPMQAAKFFSLFQHHPNACECAMRHGERRGRLSIVDLGAGPGTASLSFLLWALQNFKKIPPIDFYWFDTQKAILEDGKALVNILVEQFPTLKNLISVKTYIGSWTKAADLLETETSLIFMGNVWNEMKSSKNSDHPMLPSFFKILNKTSGGGCLIVEPAFRSSSQFLSQLRDEIFFQKDFCHIPWGPCLHTQSCPLSGGRDWCHFSMPVEIPGKWFKAFSRHLGSERHWLKFSYLWLASRDFSPPMPHPLLRRVVSDSLKLYSKENAALLCEPEQVRKLTIPPPERMYRGDLVRLLV